MPPIIQKYTPSGASAVQDCNADGSHIVALENIRVAIYPNGKRWLAQGFQIDYIAQGNSIDDVKTAFEKGLTATVHHHLKKYGDIDNLLKAAPDDVKAMALEHVFVNPSAIGATYSQVTIHDTSVLQLEYLTMAAAA